jgi:hypothetical protein
MTKPPLPGDRCRVPVAGDDNALTAVPRAPTSIPTCARPGIDRSLARDLAPARAIRFS